MTTDSHAPLSQREPLDDADFTELDFDDLPTAAETRASRLKRDSIFPPADPGRGEVFSLIERNSRPSLLLIDESPIDFGDLLREPISERGWDTIPPTADLMALPSPPVKMSSIAPVELPTLPPPASTHAAPPAERGSNKVYAVALGTLAAVAAAIALWAPAQAQAPAPTLAANAPQAAALTAPAQREAEVAREPRVLDVAEIRIVGTGPMAASTTIPPEGNAASAPAQLNTGAPPVTEGPAPVAEPVAPAELPPVEPPALTAAPFDRAAAATALSVAASQAATCRQLGTPSAQAGISVTFAPSGRVATVDVGGAYAGTSTGGCIAKTFRTLRINAFEGSPVTVHRTFQF